MTRPLDRECKLPQLGELDVGHGEFWVENPFDLAKTGQNLSAYERNRLYLNVSGQSFIDASFASSADIDSDSRSVVAADFDRDGTCDILVGSDGGGPLRLFLNRFPATNQRVRISLTGTESNRPAIGSRVVLECGGRKIVRDLFPANGYMGQSPPELLVGIGTATMIDKLTVRWPTGKSQEFTNIPGNTEISITEGNADLQINPSFIGDQETVSPETIMQSLSTAHLVFWNGLSSLFTLHRRSYGSMMIHGSMKTYVTPPRGSVP